MSKVLYGIAASALAAGTLVLGLPVAAQAAGVITVTSAGSPASHVGELSIGLEATAPIAPGSIYAKLYAPHAKKAALKVTGFVLTGGSNNGPGVTTWTVKSPISMSKLALGAYSITVHAADTDGDAVTKSRAGTLDFVIEPQISVSVSPSTYSYGNNVTISGTDIGLYPNGKKLALAGQTVNVVPGYGVATGPHGGYTATLQAGLGTGAALGSRRVQVQGVATKTIAAADSRKVHTTVVRDLVRVTGPTATAVNASYGGSWTVSGIAWYQATPTIWLQFAGMPVSVVATGDWGKLPVPSGSAVTSSSDSTVGQFSVALNNVQLPEQYTVGLAASVMRGPWFSPPASPTVVTIVPTGLPVTDTLTATEDVHGQVYFDACIAVTNPKDAPIYTAGLAAFPDLDIYANGTSLVSGAPGSNGCFSPVVAAPGAGVSYQVKSYADPAYQAGSSPEVQATQPVKTSIRSFSVSPTRIRPGQRVRVNGVLYIGSAPAGGGVRVQIVFQTHGRGSWREIASVTTNSSGKFSAHPVIRASGKLEVKYAGTASAFAGRSKVAYIGVRSRHSAVLRADYQSTNRLVP
jgi:hypothetical protein